jgi:hypothetical protein
VCTLVPKLAWRDVLWMWPSQAATELLRHMAQWWVLLLAMHLHDKVNHSCPPSDADLHILVTAFLCDHDLLPYWCRINETSFNSACNPRHYAMLIAHITSWLQIVGIGEGARLHMTDCQLSISCGRISAPLKRGFLQITVGAGSRCKRLVCVSCPAADLIFFCSLCSL